MNKTDKLIRDTKRKTAILIALGYLQYADIDAGTDKALAATAGDFCV